MKAISLWQPWASAIACRAKMIETRSWKTSYTGPIAIHAAKTWNKECAHAYGYLMEREEYCAMLPRDDNYDLLPLPFGCIVATAHLIECKPTIELVNHISPLEASLGNYDDGRWGWILKNVTALTVPIPWTGRQGFFEVTDNIPIKYDHPLKKAMIRA